MLSSGSANVALKGALLYGQDGAGVRQGSFTDKGTTNTFVPFAGCGKNPQGQVVGRDPADGSFGDGKLSF